MRGKNRQHPLIMKGQMNVKVCKMIVFSLSFDLKRIRVSMRASYYFLYKKTKSLCKKLSKIIFNHGTGMCVNIKY